MMKITLDNVASGAQPSPALARLAGVASRWRDLVRLFNQRSQRERLLLIAASTGVVVMMADQLWLAPALQAYKAARSVQARAEQTHQGVLADIQQIESRGLAHAKQQQADLLEWRQRLRDGDASLRNHADSLVGPDRMVDLLEQLLARHGEVRVRALRSLGRSDVLATNQTTNQTTNQAATARPATAGPGNSPAPSGLYRHGVELELEGGFADLLGYLKAMEALPQRVLWGGATLKVEQHPRSVLTLRVYTLSRDPHWLEL